MRKRDKAVYAPGELDRVRNKLGDIDREEAQKLARKLGGEVGYERTEAEEKVRQSINKTRRERVEVKIGDRSGRPRHALELPLEDEDDETQKRKPYRRKEMNPADDPTVPQKTNYWERVKMDRLAGQPEFEIKSAGQVLQSMLSFFSEISDYVSPAFISRRMAEYYTKIELLVVSTRNMFPRNNMKRNERMKKAAPLAYMILDVIRYWDIEKISGDLARAQSRPKSTRVSDFADIVRAVYRPLFVLGQMDLDAHIRGAYKILYKVLYLENPTEAQAKYQELIRVALTAFAGIRRDVHYFLYPLLMKLVSAKFLPYELFFGERKNRIMAFLDVDENDQIDPALINTQVDGKDQKDGEGQSGDKTAEADGDAEGQQGEAGEPEISEEEKARLAAEEAEKKALERGLKTLESLFPHAGWEQLPNYPDLYPYFVDIFDLKKGIVNIAPTDPMLQIFILMRALEELFFGLRYVKFGTVHGPSGNMERVDTILGEIITDWHYFIDVSFGKEYLPRMAEYIRILEGSQEERSSSYTKKLMTELHWIKRFYLLPFYKFESFAGPPMQKKDTTQIYVKIKTLRRYLTAVASGIELGNRAGGAEAHAPCNGIENPWEPYVFQVPNPLSIRLDAMLAPKIKNNASLIYFCLAITTVLDYLVNNEDSWAYSSRSGPLFRSVSGEGVIPLTGVDERIDADAIFKQVLKQRQNHEAK